MSANEKVAVWLDCQDDPPENEADVMMALTYITGDPYRAYYLISGRDKTSAGPWKGVVAGPVPRDEAEVIVKLLKAVGANAIIDDGYFEDTEVAS